MPSDARTLDPAARAEVDLLLEVVNESYPDTPAFLAGWTAGRTVEQASIVAVDPTGADVAVVAPDGDTTRRIAFPEPAVDADQARARWRGRIAAARADHPDRPLTSLERAYADAAAQQMHRCTVRDVVDLTWSRLQELPGGPRTTVTWVFRGGDAPGTGTRLLDAVGDLDLRAEGLFAFGAAESSCIMPVRRHLPRAVVLDRDHVHMGGYWKRAP